MIVSHAVGRNLPVNLARILKQTQSNTVHRRIAPSFVEEPTGPVEVSEIVLVDLTSPEGQIGNLKIRPEVTGAVAVCLDVVVWSSLIVCQPLHSVVLVQVFRVGRQELDGFRP